MIQELMEIQRSTIGSAGYDFKAPKDMVLRPFRWYKIDTYVVMPNQIKGFDDFFMLVAPRSSLGMNYGFRFANTVSIIDQDYRDTIKMKVKVSKTLRLKKGDRIAQGIFIPYAKMYNEIVPTETRKGGIGSTGMGVFQICKKQ